MHNRQFVRFMWGLGPVAMCAPFLAMLLIWASSVEGQQREISVWGGNCEYFQIVASEAFDERINERGGRVDLEGRAIELFLFLDTEIDFSVGSDYATEVSELMLGPSLSTRFTMVDSIRPDKRNSLFYYSDSTPKSRSLMPRGIANIRLGFQSIPTGVASLRAALNICTL